LATQSMLMGDGRPPPHSRICGCGMYCVCMAR